jgi:hypothetical protein
MSSGAALRHRILLPTVSLVTVLVPLLLRGEVTGAGPGVVDRIGPGGDYSAIAISANSIYVAFDREVINRKTGERVAVAPGSSAYNPLDLSANARVFAFASADAIVPEDTNDCGPGFPASCQDVYVYDRGKGAYELVSVSSDGAVGNDHSGWYDDIAISAAGRHVAFVSFATNLVPDDIGDGVFVRDRLLGVTARVFGPGASGGLAVNMNADGRFITFDANGGIYLHDRDSDGNGVFDEAGGTETKRVSDGSYPVISDDGSALAFYLDDEIVYYDVLASAKFSVAPAPLFGGTGMDLSKDGRYLVFATDQPLSNEDDNGFSDVYLYEHRSPIMSTRPQFELLSRRQGGPVGNGFSAWGFPLEHLATIALTPDARFAAFETWAPNLGGPGVVLAGTSVRGGLGESRDTCAAVAPWRGATVATSSATGR